MSHDALRQLRALHWLPASSPQLSAPLLDWLMEEDSMTRRFEQHCQQVTVKLIREAFIGAEEISEEAEFLPADPRFWLREIVLCGDGEPWLIGRTVDAATTRYAPAWPLSVLFIYPEPRFYRSRSGWRFMGTPFPPAFVGQAATVN